MSADKKQNTDDLQCYRKQEACELLGISRATLDRRIRSGEIKQTRIGSIGVITRQEIIRLQQ